MHEKYYQMRILSRERIDKTSQKSEMEFLKPISPENLSFS